MSGGVPGLLVAGRYRLAESIGQGGMGRVWRAADEILDRRVAVKEMRMNGLDPEDSRTRRERTLREARATARIDHPNVVRVYDVVDEGELLWIVMELVHGRSLEQIMAEEGPLSPRETAGVGLGLVAALRQVHAGGVLHRDIKPGNVLVESGARRVVLTDFGIAAIQDAKALTMVGMLVGSPDYMAPERVSGRPQGPPSDVWSLGATLCAALGGRSPFSRDTTLATLHAVLYEEPELPAGAGPLREVLASLLEKDPEVRPSLADLEAALRPVAFPEPTPTLPVLGGHTRPMEDPPDPAPDPPDTAREPSDSAAGPSGGAPGGSSAFTRSPSGSPSGLSGVGPGSSGFAPGFSGSASGPSGVGPGSSGFAQDPSGIPPDRGPAGFAPDRSGFAGDHPNASTEVPSAERPEARSKAPAGVSLSRARAVTERRPEAGPGAGAGSGAGVVPPGPAVPSAHRGGRRRTGLIAATGVAAVGAVVAIVLIAVPGGPPGGAKAGDASSPSPSSSATTEPSGTPSPTVKGTSRPPSLPPGAHQEAGGFAWATPRGWRRDVKTGAEVHYTSPDGGQEIAAKSALARGDLMKTWQTSEQNAHQGQDYRKIRLEGTTFRGRPAVVWEYTFTLQGVHWHARLLGFDQDGKSYQINTWYHEDIESQALSTYGRVRDSFTVL